MWQDGHNLQSADNVSVTEKMVIYEAAVKKAVSNKVPLEDGIVPTQWTYTQSVFFASTVLTTIGTNASVISFQSSSISTAISHPEL